MADKPKIVSGTINGVRVTTTEENASRIGAFESESKSTSSKPSSSRKTSK